MRHLARSPFSFALTLAVFLLANLAFAADQTFSQLTIGKTTYTNAVVTSKTATDVFILHKGGVASFKLKNLAPDLQKQFGFDAEKAAALEKKQADSLSDYNQARAALNSVSNSPASKEIWAKSFLDQKAPDLIVEKWVSAAPETEGKFALLVFWRSSSEPCQKAIPLFNNLHQKFGQRLVVIGLSDEPEEIVRTFNEPTIDFYSAIDSAARTLRTAEVRGLPHVMLIDPAGIVRWEGFPSLAGNALTENVIQTALTKYTP